MSKTILITGASTGIGAALADHLAEGNTILIHYAASEEAAQHVAASVTRRGGTPLLLQADLTSEAGCMKLIDEVTAQCDHLDVLINNAGALIQRQAAEAFTWALIEQTFTLNVFSLFMLTSRCIPLLQRGTHPCIINITSIAMRHGAPSAIIYGASKGAVDSFTRGLARELAPTIRVNAVAPGVILTPFHDKVSTPEHLENWKATNPLRMNGPVSSIVSATTFLIDNPFMTGETVDVNGGAFMR